MKKPLTKEQEINLLWLKIKRNNNEISASTYKAVKSCIKNNKPIVHIKEMSDIEKEYLQVFTMPQNAEFISECFRIQSELHKELEKSKNPPRLTNAVGKYAKEFYDNIDNPNVPAEETFKWVAIRKEKINN